MKNFNDLKKYCEANLTNEIKQLGEARKKVLSLHLIKVISIFYFLVFILGSAVNIVFDVFLMFLKLNPVFIFIFTIILFVFIYRLTGIGTNYLLTFRRRYYRYFQNPVIYYGFLGLSVIILVILLRFLHNTPFVSTFGMKKDASDLIKRLLLPLAYCVGYFIIFVILVIALKIFEKEKAFNKLFKKFIISNITAFLNPNSLYSDEYGMPVNDFVKIAITERKPDKINIEDYVLGEINQVKYEFFFAEAIENKSDDDTSTLFCGIIFKADFNKNFAGKTLLLPDVTEKVFGPIARRFQGLNARQLQLAELESPEFEKNFKVLTSDQVEARYILSTSLMERLVNIRKKILQDISISFAESEVYIILPLEGNPFNPDYVGKILNNAALERYYSYFQLMFGIVDDLNLNTRIWSKT